MSNTPWQTVLVVPALFLLLPPGATAQQSKTASPHPSDSKTSKTAKAPDRLPLRSVTMVNTTDAARKVAEEESARKQLEKAAGLTGKQSEPGKAAGSAVLEFHPTDETPAADSAKEKLQVKGRKKPVLKNIHGSAYGAAASGIGANGERGAVGADSRGGKFNVYVEGEHTHGSTPGPH